MAIVFYVINYTTKVEDLVWKQIVVAAELFYNLDKLITKHQVEIVKTADSYRKSNNI